MTDRPNLNILLADPARATEVPVAEVPAALAQLAAEVTKLAALQSALAARLSTTASDHREEGDNDVVSDVHEVARLVRRSVSWVRKRGHTLPGFQQPGGKGCKVSWSRRALVAWTSSPS